jgi:regulator of sigma E protease
MSAIQNTVFFIIFLGVLVTVHELGHFLVAKACNVKVLKFSIGFGPRIFGFTKGETEYRVAWLPLGGYVKMAGQEPDDEVAPEDVGRSFQAQTWWKRALIVVAGPAFNLLFPIIAFFFVYVGSTQVIAPRVGWLEPELPAARAGIKPGDYIKKIDGKEVRSFGEIRELVSGAANRDVTITLERDKEEVIVTLQPMMTTETDPIEKVQRGLLGIWPRGRAPIVGVPKGSPAEVAGLRTFDRILTVNGEVVRDELQFEKAIAKASGTLELSIARSQLQPVAGATIVVPELATVKLEKQPGEGFAALGVESGDLYVWSVSPGTPAATAGIKRGDRLVKIDQHTLSSWMSVELELTALEKKPFQLTWRSDGVEKTQELAQAMITVEDDFKNRLEQLELGLLERPAFRGGRDPLAGGPSEELVTLTMGPKDALVASVKNLPKIIRKIGLIFYRLFTGHVPLESVGGPIMLFQVASKSAELGVETFIGNMALVSVNLGLVNLLPIPVLDGFALLAALWEGIRRRPIPIKAREYANLVGLAMLAVLMVLVFKNDITRMLR